VVGDHDGGSLAGNESSLFRLISRSTRLVRA
jgi:hypothetical protein